MPAKIKAKRIGSITFINPPQTNRFLEDHQPHNKTKKIKTIKKLTYYNPKKPKTI